jgi:hypothetical protein
MAFKYSVIAIAVLFLAACDQKDSSDKPDSSDVLKNRTFLASNPKYPEAITNLIRERGFECPKLHELWLKGDSPYGPKLEALCGPEGGDEITTTQHYAVYPDQFKVNLCPEFSMLSSDCS